MHKRLFLRAAALAGAGPVPGQSAAIPGKGPALLTVTGAIGKPNRGPFDQMMHKHKIRFGRAFTFDFTTLINLPAFAIRPTLE